MYIRGLRFKRGSTENKFRTGCFKLVFAARSLKHYVLKGVGRDISLTRVVLNFSLREYWLVVGGKTSESSASFHLFA